MNTEPLWFRLPPRSTVDPAPPPDVETGDGAADRSTAAPIDVPAGTTIIDACKTLGIDIPTLCYLETLTPINACRVCVVEVEGARVLAPACSRKVESGMVVKTRSPRVDLSRKVVLELLASSVDLSTAPTLEPMFKEYGADPGAIRKRRDRRAAGEDRQRPLHPRLQQVRALL